MVGRYSAEIRETIETRGEVCGTVAEIPVFSLADLAFKGKELVGEDIPALFHGQSRKHAHVVLPVLLRDLADVQGSQNRTLPGDTLLEGHPPRIARSRFSVSGQVIYKRIERLGSR